MPVVEFPACESRQDSVLVREKKLFPEVDQLAAIADNDAPIHVEGGMDISAAWHIQIIGE